MLRILLIFMIIFLFSFTLNAFDTIRYTTSNGKIQNDHVHDVFFYDTSQDNISDSWRYNDTLSWYQEPSNPSDDFTGSLDNLRWVGTGNPVVKDTVAFSASGIGTLQSLSSQTKWNIVGDFDLQISFKNWDTENEGELRFEIKDSENNYAFVSKKSEGGVEKYKKDINGYGITEVDSVDVEGRLRLSKNGNDISAYYTYWDFGNAPDEDRWKWEEIGTPTSFTGNDTIFLNIYTYTTQDTSMKVTVDNFSANKYDDCTLGNIGSHTRGTKNTFPEQTILVSSEMGLDIIDASTDELWMRYKAYDGKKDEARFQNMVADKIHTVFALDGTIYCGAYDGYMLGVGTIDFKTDKAWFYDAHEGFDADGTGWNYLSDILSRNMHQGWTDNGASYIKLLGWKVYDLHAKMINRGKEDNTYLAVANGLDNENEKGTVLALNISNNTKSYNIISDARPIKFVEIGENNKLYYCEPNKIYVDSMDFLNPGSFVCDDWCCVSLHGQSEPADIITTNSYFYLADVDGDTLQNIEGRTQKFNLNNLNYTSIEYRRAGYPKVRLWGSSSCSALETNGSALWIATNNSYEGRIYVIGAEHPREDTLRGDFNIPYPLESGEISSLSFGETTTYPENLIIGYGGSGVVRLQGSENELSINNPLDGGIQHNFCNDPSLKGKPFSYIYDSVNINVDPPNSGSGIGTQYGNLTVVLHNENPPNCPHPEHTLDMWYELSPEAGYDRFPVNVNVKFSAPQPEGSSNLKLWSYYEPESEWIPDNLDEGVNVNVWNFLTVPDSVNYTTNHYSSWTMNNGGGGALSYPPKKPENLCITISNSDIILKWNKVTKDIGGYDITNVIYKIYCADLPYFSDTETYYLDTVSDTTFTHENILPADKLFYKVTAKKIYYK